MNLYRSLLAACPVVAAPLADISDFPFRRMLRRTFEGLVHTEMVSVNALDYGDEHTIGMIATVPREPKPLGIQILAGDAETVRRVIDRVVSYEPTVIDINMACPVRKIMKSGCGATLLDDPETAAAIASAAVRSGLPVGVKLRLGITAPTIRDLAKRLADVGVSALTIHGRTARQGYAGRADRALAVECGRASGLPFIVSGDMFSVEDIRGTLALGADGVLIARGMIGRPWFPAQVAAALAGQEIPTAPHPLLAAREHLDCFIEHFGPASLPSFRKHLVAYVHGLPGAARWRDRLVRANDVEEVRQILLDSSIS